MHRRTWGTAAIAAAIAFGSVSMFVRAAGEAKPAAEAPKAEPAKGDDAKPAMKKAARLTKPWSGLTSLTEDQSAKIREIHRKAIDEINAIEEREKSEIMALLTDAQKSELKTLAEADAASRKAATKKPAAKKDADAPAKEAPAKAS
jgi:Spy/CpxP family protein refolding chaperone